MLKKIYKNELLFQFNMFYILVILILVPVITLFFFFQCRHVLYNVISSDMCSLIQKSVQISDSKMQSAKEYALGFLTDRETKRLLRAAKECQSDSEYYFLDREFKQLSDKYFMASSDIYSVNISSGEYIFCTAAGENFIPKGVFEKSEIYKAARENRDKMVWIPTYRFYEMYHQQEFEKITNLDYYYMFSLVRNLNELYGAVSADDSSDIQVMMINFVDSFWDDVFSDDLRYDNLCHIVIDQKGNVITHNNAKYIGTDLCREWAGQIGGHSSGTANVTINSEKNMIFYGQSAVTGWISMYAIPESNLSSYYFRMLYRYSIIILIVIFCSIILFSYGIKRLVVTPVISLTQEVSKLKNQPTYQIQEQGSYEMRNLIATYNDMNRSVQELLRKNFEMENMYQETRLKEINLQLNPHFIYNILNMLNLELIRDGRYESCEILDDVTYMMRYVLDNDNITETFEKDLHYTLHYIDVMNRRYKGMYRLDLDIDARLNSTMVPKFMLQPIIENVYRHAFMDITDRAYIIRIKCYIYEKRRYFCVEDNGRGIDDEKLARINEGKEGSIGLNNTRERVRYLYGEEARLVAEQAAEGGTKISIILP